MIVGNSIYLNFTFIIIHALNFKIMKQLIEKVNECSIYVEIKGDQRTWTMESIKTGIHVIKDIKDNSNPLRPSARVRNHWSGFLSNQTTK
jgi:hypothetical protein